MVSCNPEEVLALLSRQKPFGSLCFILVCPDCTKTESRSGPDPIDKHPLKKRSRLNAPNNFHKFLKKKAPILFTDPTPI